MAIRKLTTSTIENNVWYKSLLAGNEAFNPSEFDLLATTTIGTAASTITFSSLDTYTDYKHLQLRGVLKTTRADTSDAVSIRFNSDTGSNYANHRLRGNGSTVSSQAATSTTSAEIGNIAGNTTANVFSPFILDLLDFRGTKNKTTRTLIGAASSIELYSGLWQNTGSLTSVTFIPAVGPNWQVGTRISLYGSKG